ncbi:MAG: uracil-DNA glycosylase family protein [Muribaculaceae bacterium]|nr:uracil-DNA glycosylase family protein [Muribaculaceae bacterium]MDE6331906.1 uracil-DNA glycosylase family protein [Muribaculaceae bacterium]
MEIESHPWPPFLPQGAKVLVMGTFPPQQKRWAMDFYYPNRTNDFWPMMGLIFYGNRDALYNRDTRSFRLENIIQLLEQKGIAMSDTGRKIRRLKGNASDKFLEIVEPAPLFELLGSIPTCHSIATTGEKAAGVIANLTGTEIPRMGEMTVSATGLEIWRMPSTSRAYPLALEKKAAYYAAMFRHIGII